MGRVAWRVSCPIRKQAFQVTDETHAFQHRIMCFSLYTRNVSIPQCWQLKGVASLN